MVGDETPSSGARLKEFGRQDDPFRKLGRIGKGGQGRVYKCMRMSDESLYAAKVIDMTPDDKRKGPRAAEERRKRLLHLKREVACMRELHHPKLVNLHEYFQEPEGPPTTCIIVMDFCERGDLYDYLQAEILAVQERGFIFSGLGGCEAGTKYVAGQILDGMAYMHNKKIIHRDLKLDNIFIQRTLPIPEAARGCTAEPLPQEFLDIKIGDFGFSRPVPSVLDRPEIARSMSLLGTPDYLAPEILTREYDSAVDYWSFGIIVYSCLCGRPPFYVTDKDLRPNDVERLKRCVANMSKLPPWDSLTPAARGFIEGLLVVDSGARFGLDECANHPWQLAAPLWPESQPTSNEFAPPPSPGGRPSSAATAGPKRRAAVKKLVGRMGSAVDSIRLELRKGGSEFHGGAGGLESVEMKLRADELIVAVLQETRHDFLGNALCFFTSEGRTFTVAGTERHRRKLFAAPVDSQIVGLQFEGSEITGIYLKDAPPECPPAVASLSGRVGYAVDAIKFELANGRARSYGEDGGREVPKWQLLPNEHLIALDQASRDAYLGCSVSFYTSAGRIFKLIGMQNTTCMRFAARTGRQICGLNFHGAKLAGVRTCPDTGFSASEVEVTPIL